MTAGVAAPVARRRLRLPRAATLGAAALAPAALTVAARRTRARDAAVCALQMWAYIAAYEMPNDDPETLRARVHVDYPIAIDRAIGLGKIPTQRLQETLSDPASISPPERLLAWSHWIWFLVPHTTVAYIWWRHPERFPSAAARMYAVFDLGATVYWALPTAPPWWAALHGDLGGAPIEHSEFGELDAADHPPVRRMMLEYGQEFWGDRWPELYDVLGGNPLAAMPSLHFATSLMAARLLSENGRVAGAVGWTYAATLGLALVYLGEHYAIDVIVGGTLAETVYRLAPRSARPASAIAGVLGRLRAAAEG